MKLKKIDKAIVHCKTKEEAEQVVNCYCWNNNEESLINYWDSYKENTCYRIERGHIGCFCDYEYYKKEGYEITEFADLIEPELTSEEAIEWICKHYFDGEYINAFGEDYAIRDLAEAFPPKEIAEKIAKWKAEHEKQDPEKQEPEVEYVNVCRIIEIDESGHEKCVHEELIDLCKPTSAKMTDILKRYMATHEGHFMAVQAFVCRVKKG